MKRWICALIVLLLAASVPAGVLGDSSALAEGSDVTAEVVQSSCSIVQSDDYCLVYCYAQVHNSTSQTLSFTWGTFELYSGDQLLCTQQISKLWPSSLKPGEDGYLFDVVFFEPDEDGSFIPSVTSIDYYANYLPIDAQYAGEALVCTPSITYDQMGDGLYVVCEMSNPTEETAYNPTVTFGLYIDSGAMIYAGGTTLLDVGVPPGGSTFVRFAVDDSIVSQWTNYGVSPTQVQAKALFRDNLD